MNKKILKLLCFLLLSAICHPPSAFLFAAEPVTKVTAVVLTTVEGRETAAVTLNDHLVIREIKINREHRSGIITLVYPEYISKQERVIPQVVVESQKLGEEIRKAVAEQKPGTEKPVDIVYKIVKISKYRDKNSQVKAFSSIIFNNAVRVEARIMDSASGLWIAWPGRKAKDGAWVKQFDLVSQPLKQAIEKAILAKYTVVQSEEP
ncbi:MAG: septation protein SpoVG family protein [bacterium]|nr:septation protein SpoVG family protein [bacterium]